MTPDLFEPKGTRLITNSVSVTKPNSHKDFNQLILENLRKKPIDDPDELRIALEEIGDDPYNPLIDSDE